MTTTIDLDADVERMLLKQMELSNQSLQETINASLRKSFSQTKDLNQKLPTQIADELADEEFLRKMNRTEPL